MSKGSPSTSDNRNLESARSDAPPSYASSGGKAITAEKHAKFIEEVVEKLNAGQISQAKRLAYGVIENYSLSHDAQAQFRYHISIAYECEGRFPDSLEVLREYENDAFAEIIGAENQVRIYARLGFAHALNSDPKQAVNFLDKSLKVAEERDFTHLLAEVNLAFARHYRLCNEYAISRNYVDRSIKFARESGDWLALAEGYRFSGAIYLELGNSEKSNEVYQQALKTIGDRPANFLLARIYSELAIVNINLFQFSAGSDFSKKAVTIFEKCDNDYNRLFAESFLGLNLLLKGEWKKAAAILEGSAEKAIEIDHHCVALLLSNAAQLPLLRGDFAEAEKLLLQAFAIAEERKNETFLIRILYSLSQCYLAQKRTSDLNRVAKELTERSEKLSETSFKSLILFVLARNRIQQNQIFEAEKLIQQIEDSEFSKGFFAMGTTATLRGMLSLRKKDDISAIHYFTQSISCFGKTEDIYQIAQANFRLGKVLLRSEAERSKDCFEEALTIYRKLDLQMKIDAAADYLEKLERKALEEIPETPLQVNLLLLRLLSSISSRDVLFRELMSILREVEKTSKIIVSESNGKRFLPSFVEGFSPTESVELVAKVQTIEPAEELNRLAETNNLSIFHLHAPNANPAILITHPALESSLSDGSLLHPLLKIVELGMELCTLRERSREIEAELDAGIFATGGLMPGFIHSSPSMTEIVDEICKIRTSDVTVLITGESGTGKELVAKAVHLVSNRKEKSFVPFNCTAVPKELTEGHLFGYKKGAFTGAIADSPGVIRSADGGTLFLDEIGDLPLDVQPKILRFLQEGEVQTLGEKSPKKVDVRIIAATNMNLEEKVRQGLFREDLYYRLNVIRLRVPALRDRRSEIPELVNYYIKYYSAKFGRQDLSISSQAMDLLIAQNWQGNIRQLCNEVQRIVARSESGDRIGSAHLSVELRPIESKFAKMTGNLRAITLEGGLLNVQTQGGSLNEVVSAVEIQLISESLRRHGDNIARAAKELGLTRRGLYMKIGRYKIREKSDEAVENESE